MHQIIKTIKKTVPALTTALTSPKLGTSLKRGACLAQNRGLSPRRDMQQWPLGDFTSSRSGEAFSPERDKASLKTWLAAWASARGRIFGELLLFSPRRGELAWARIPVLPHCSAHATQNKQTKHLSFYLTQAQTFSNSFYATTEGKTSTYNERRRILASLTLLRC